MFTHQLTLSKFDFTTRIAASTIPPIKWAGSKRWLTPFLKSIWEIGDYNDTYVFFELFSGSAALTFALNPKRVILNDANVYLQNLYKHIADGSIDPQCFDMVNYAETYYEQRTAFNEGIKNYDTSSAVQALRFYYLNRTGYNGLCRFNKSGLYNVPFGKHKTIKYIQDFTPFTRLLRGALITSHDFANTPYSSNPNTFVYVDPPYDTFDIGFTSYDGSTFGWGEQIRLSNFLKYLDGPIIASNAATPRVLKLYHQIGFDVYTASAPRRISCTGDRENALEMIAFKNLKSNVKVVIQSNDHIQLRKWTPKDA